ncbi:SIR2 family NAD-dependent protein deacylase [Xylella taiwanensis]|uniref:SIR2 family protein n=2 Tax=Xylella taiwanensis TaxID=1444770 RepID=A0ABS8TVW8_9GAMM|nr:SIR2 family protein [Xylella taiwanensis]MCD8458126.1 SIR2 family protein [Xylella taiwanensis]MCD8460262.1 SIR2 family protein [Xylella taiwanensis]MCD8463681.1 SIR2 family protein [Xylella taiwanensis]MCD8467677.1 SIR2 family protein [Xylella taiwanensis]MCD8469988.1 SIR2 family protein [Xylella taiwanensis]
MMDIKALRDNTLIVDKVEEALQAAYSSNEAFNAVLDEAPPLSFKSLRDPEHEYFVKVSEALYWVERETYLDELRHWEEQREINQHQAAITCITSSDQRGVFSDLVNAMRLRRIAPFVGAGLSKACGDTMWGEALRNIAPKLDGLEVQDIQDIEPLMARYDDLQAAQVLHDAAAEHVTHFIKTEFRQRGAIVGPVRLLTELANGCIVTTNVDTVIEDLFRERGQPLDGYMHGTQAGHNFVQRLLRGERCILKRHGDAGQDNTHVFTQAQYQAAYGEPFAFQNQLPRALRQIFISHSLLFLGCSMEQDKTLDLFKHVVDEAAFEIPDHFALLNEPATAAERVL